MIYKTLHANTSLVQIYDLFRANHLGESAFLDSCGKGRYSYLALFPYCTFKSKDNKITITENNNVRSINGNPFDELKKLIDKFKQKYKNKKYSDNYNKNFPLLNSGCIGYLGYGLVRFLEKIPSKAKDDLKLPDSYFIFPSIIIAANHKKNLLYIFSSNNNKKGIEFILNLIKGISSIYSDSDNNLDNKKDNNDDKKRNKLDYSVIKKYNIKSSLTWPQYKKIALKAREYVHAGDSFQIKISQRLEFEIDEEPWQIYKKLRAINPSPYSAFVDFNDVKLISCSPEHLLKVKRINTNKNSFGNEYLAETRPIGGTYPRGKNSKEDKKIAQKFFNDKKELAEHTMLIDLERNDLGRVCRYGTVKVNEMMKLEKYSHLMHIVTNIQGILDDGKSKKNRKDCFDAIKAMFPGGTITGCPKVRTMEIIDELEPVARGPYTGCIGGFNFNNECDFNLIIRTLILKPTLSKNLFKGYLNIGGGIVADSKPRREYDETIEKGLAVVEAVKNKDS